MNDEVKLLSEVTNLYELSNIYKAIMNNNDQNRISNIAHGVTISLLNEKFLELIQEATGSDHLILSVKSKAISIYIRTKDTSRNNSNLQHGPSIKIGNKINGETNVSILVPDIKVLTLSRKNSGKI